MINHTLAEYYADKYSDQFSIHFFSIIKIATQALRYKKQNLTIPIASLP
jgi:hypothetical protein